MVCVMFLRYNNKYREKEEIKMSKYVRNFDSLFNKIYKVYCHIFPTGKLYFGITEAPDCNIRWSFGNGYKSNIAFMQELKKTT